VTNRPYPILIVEDNSEDRELYRRRISRDEHHEYEFREAGTVGDGLRMCREPLPDCILLDLHLPDGDGLEFLAQFQTEFTDSDTSIVMLTGHGNEAVAVKAMKMGAHDYLRKSLDNENLGQVVRSAIYKTELRRKLAEQDRAMQALSQERVELIAQLEQQTASLTEAHRRKDEFLAMLAHELRNPLAPLRNGLHILRSHPNDAALRGTIHPVMERQVEHLARLVDDLLDVSRINHGKVELVKESVDVNTLLRRAAESCKPLIDARRHDLKLVVPNKPVTFDADPIRMEQIVNNLLNNAAKYTPEGGEIVLSGGLEGSEIVIRVRDNGIGISADLLPNVFEMFTQADHSLARSQGGLGIGLTLVSLLVKLHGGTVEARSAGLGLGTEFAVRVPAGKVCVAPTSTPTAPLPNADRSLQVLVVDDNLDAAQTLSMLIKLSGHDVSVAHDGPTAISMIDICKPQVVVLDIGMPGMNGYEVAEQVRATKHKQTLLIGISGYGRDEDLARARAAGFDHYLVKPVDLDRLRTLLTKAAEPELSR
jgi:signal transduction histidine kinase